MKRLLIYAFAVTLVATLLTSTANAGNAVDKGALGKYERQGRFVKPVLTSATRSKSQARAESLVNEGRVIIDKGELGKYERQGRFVKPIVEIGQNSWPNRGRKMDQGGVKHVHGLNGKEHKNVKK